MKTPIKLPDNRSQYLALNEYIKEMIVQSKEDIRAWNTPINAHEWDKTHITVLTVEDHATVESKVTVTFTIAVEGASITAKLHYGKCDITQIVEDLTNYTVDAPFELGEEFDQNKLDELFTTEEDTGKGLFNKNAILSGLLAGTEDGTSTGTQLGARREIAIPLLAETMTDVSNEEVIKLKANLQSKMIHGVAKLPVLVQLTPGFLDGFAGIIETNSGHYIDGGYGERGQYIPHRDSGVIDAELERTPEGNLRLISLTVKETRDVDESRYTISVNGHEVVTAFPGSNAQNASNSFGPVKEGERKYRIDQIIDLSKVGGLQDGAEIVIGLHTRVKSWGYGEYLRLIMRYSAGAANKEGQIVDENASETVPSNEPSNGHGYPPPHGGDEPPPPEPPEGDDDYGHGEEDGPRELGSEDFPSGRDPSVSDVVPIFKPPFTEGSGTAGTESAAGSEAEPVAVSENLNGWDEAEDTDSVA